MERRVRRHSSSVRHDHDHEKEHHDHIHPAAPTERNTSGRLSERKIKFIKGGQLASLTLQTVGVGLEMVQHGWGAINTAALMGMVHDASDVEAWRQDLKQELSDEERQKSERRTHHLIFWGGAYPLAEGTAGAFGTEWHENGHNMWNTVAALGSTGIAAATTGIVGATILKNYNSPVQFLGSYRHREKSARRFGKRLMHGLTDVISSSAVLANTTDVLSHQASSAIMALGAGALMFHYRPTKKNLEEGHVCAIDHGHSHHDHAEESHSVGCKHDHEVVQNAIALHSHDETAHFHPINATKILAREIPRYRRRSSYEQFRSQGQHHQEKHGSWRRVAAIGTAALTLASGVIVGGSTIGSYSNSETSAAIMEGPHPNQSPVVSAIVEDSMAYGSLWEMSGNQIHKATDSIPSQAETNVVTKLTAYINRDAIPDPNVIQRGAHFKRLTNHTISAIVGENTHDPKVDKSIAVVNSQPCGETALIQTDTLNYILAFAKQAR